MGRRMIENWSTGQARISLRRAAALQETNQTKQKEKKRKKKRSQGWLIKAESRLLRCINCNQTCS